MYMLIPAIIFAVLGGVIGFLLAAASKAFAVPVNEKAEKIASLLPGANCGGCGYSGCAALAEAIASGKAKPSSCTVGGDEVSGAICGVMGLDAEKTVRMRAQVMCSGTLGRAKHKYVYKGIDSCIAAMQLGGGSKACPNGCLGLGACAERCPFGAIDMCDGVAKVDYIKCRGCGVCVQTCPKHIIKLVPYESRVYVGCMSEDKGAVTRSYCESGCIGCRICEKNCPEGAVSVKDNVASIDYSKCTGCGKCAEKCPRGVIHFSEIS